MGWWVDWVGWVGWCKVIIVSNPTKLRLGYGWVVVRLGFWQYQQQLFLMVSTFATLWIRIRNQIGRKWFLWQLNICIFLFHRFVRWETNFDIIWIWFSLFIFQWFARWIYLDQNPFWGSLVRYFLDLDLRTEVDPIWGISSDGHPFGLYLISDQI